MFIKSRSLSLLELKPEIYKYSITEFHRMVWVERCLKDYLVPTLLQWAGTAPTGPGCSKCIQPGPTHLQREGIHTFTAQIR